MDVKPYFINSSQIKFVDEQHSHTKWVNVVSALRHQMANSTAQKWLLYESDTFMFSAMFFALLASGKSIVMPQNSQPEHIREVKKQAQASIGSASIVPDIETPIYTTTITTAYHSDIQIDANAEITFFTSGSTGQPKIITKHLWQLQREVDVLESTFGDSVQGSVILSTVSHQHIYGLLYKLLWPMTKYHRFISQAFEYPEQIVTAIQKNESMATTIVSSPAQLQRLCENNNLEEVKDQIKTIFSSGGPLDAGKNISLQQQLECSLVEVYGSTETGGVAWRKRQSEDDDIWQTFTGMKIGYQANSELLLLSSPYIKEAHYPADDRIEIVTPCQFKLLGRADDLVKIEEKRISLNEVQMRLRQHEYISDAYVLVTGKARKQIAVVIALNSDGEAKSNSLPRYQLNRLFKAFLGQWFEAITLPKRFRYIQELPYNPQGKLNKQAMESYFE